MKLPENLKLQRKGSGQASKPKGIKSSNIRWVILFFACIVLMGDAFSFDNPQSLETQMETIFEINQVEFNLLYSVYSIPNIILPLFGGYLIDHCGVRFNIILFSSLLVLGQIIFTISVIQKLFWLAVVGRLIFGIGSECLTISQTSLVTYWFGYQELSLAVGLNLSVPRLGGALNSYFIPKIYERNKSLEEPLYFSTILCFLCSFVCALVLVAIDKKFRPATLISIKQKENQSPEKHDTSIGSTHQAQLSMRSSRAIRPFDNIFEMYPKYGVKLEQNSEEVNESDEKVQELPKSSIKESIEMVGPYNQNDKVSSQQNLSTKSKLVSKQQKKEDKKTIKTLTDNNDEKVLFHQINELPRLFWLLLVISSLAESLFIPFLNNANKLYQHRFGFSNVRAGDILVVPYLSAALFTPFVGIYMSFKGNTPRAKYILIAAFMFLLTHLSFAMLNNCLNECVISIFPLVLLGVSFSGFASVIMPSIPIFIDDERVLGTAFGLVAIFQNLLLSLFPLISAQVFESVQETSSSSEAGFQYVSALFVGTSALLVGVSFLLYFKGTKADKMKQIKSTPRQIQRVNVKKDFKLKLPVTEMAKNNQIPQDKGIQFETKSLNSPDEVKDSKDIGKNNDMFNLEITELNMQEIFE